MPYADKGKTSISKRFALKFISDKDMFAYHNTDIVIIQKRLLCGRHHDKDY